MMPLVLVVEDNKLIQKAYSIALKDVGYIGEIVGLCTQALMLLEANQYDLVLMDIGLPDRSGIEVTRLFRQSNIQNIYTPIIAMTAYLSSEIICDCLEAGCNLILSKTISLKE